MNAPSTKTTVKQFIITGLAGEALDHYKELERKDGWIKVLADNNIESYYPAECFDVNVLLDEGGSNE